MVWVKHIRISGAIRLLGCGGAGKLAAGDDDTGISNPLSFSGPHRVSGRLNNVVGSIVGCLGGGAVHACATDWMPSIGSVVAEHELGSSHRFAATEKKEMKTFVVQSGVEPPKRSGLPAQTDDLLGANL